MLIQFALMLFPKAARTIAEIQLFFPMAKNGWEHRDALFYTTATRIQHVDPFKDPAQIPVMSSCVTDKATAQRSRNTASKFETGPSLRYKLLNQRCPMSSGTNFQDSRSISLFRKNVRMDHHLCDNSSYTIFS